MILQNITKLHITYYIKHFACAQRGKKIVIIYNYNIIILIYNILYINISLIQQTCLCMFKSA